MNPILPRAPVRIHSVPSALSTLVALSVTALLGACGGGDGGSAPGSNPGGIPGAQGHCGVPTGPRVLTGLVVRVFDGDTLTVSDQGRSVSVRLEGIDAPESTQPYGAVARDALARMVLDQTVTVTYSETDRYGRVLGSVFTEACTHANRELLASGHAWFYAAYQCDLPRILRTEMKAAEASARLSALGLWAQAAPQAPWVFRNGSDPAVPNCTD